MLGGFSHDGALAYAYAAANGRHVSAVAVLDANCDVTALRESSEDSVSAWFASAPPHPSLRETVELDEVWCGTTPRPELSGIRVPLFYLGAAGAFGDSGLHSTPRVSSTDVTALFVRRFGPERMAEDFGHGDLLYAADAPTLGSRGWQREPFASDEGLHHLKCRWAYGPSSTANMRGSTSKNA
ncbi:hypothetical protein [Myxococcus xanthus]|uniref:hypothetical protein n=1 Tax=Myxococcus xanthus TaxID=34 RepID=UPI0020A36E5B|nr:hypothetical protein [Myxococcus xanthus]